MNPQNNETLSEEELEQELKRDARKPFRQIIDDHIAPKTDVLAVAAAAPLAAWEYRNKIRNTAPVILNVAKETPYV